MHIWKGVKLEQPFTQLPQHFFTKVTPSPLNKVRWVDWNKSLSSYLGFPSIPDEEMLAIFSGSTTFETLPPIAMKYVGHQFGVFNPELGDGRGLLLCQVQGNDSNYDIHIKGSGITPYSRQGDGRAVLRSSIREYLMSEAMHGLGVPTSRALGLIVSDTPVYREQIEQGAICIRAAKTHIRFGHFEYLFYANKHDDLRLLADYVIEEHFPTAHDAKCPYLFFFKQVISKTAFMIAYWQSIGFSHGVMNTDNMSILGETFDYGPFGMMEKFDPSYICNHSDFQGRYAFDNQPSMGLWNLTALGQSLSPLVERNELESALDEYYSLLTKEYSVRMRAKLGLKIPDKADTQLFNDLFSLMQFQQADYTNTFRALSNVDVLGSNSFISQFTEKNQVQSWFQRYQQRLECEHSDTNLRCSSMRTVNPKYVLRNHMAQQAIEMANVGDYSEVKRLKKVLEKPYSEESGLNKDTDPAPDWAQGLSLSCSS